MAKGNEQLTVKHLRVLWKKRVFVFYQVCNGTVNKHLQNIEQKESSLPHKYNCLLVATQGANQKLQELGNSWKDLLNTTPNVENLMHSNEVAIDDVQQYLQPDCLEIVGIPLVPQDNPKQFVQEVGSLLDVDIVVNDISTAHRLPTNGS